MLTCKMISRTLCTIQAAVMILAVTTHALAPWQLHPVAPSHQHPLLSATGTFSCENTDWLAEKHGEGVVGKIGRREALSSILPTSTLLLAPAEASALPFPLWKAERRQLELCIVTVLRTRYFAASCASAINDGIKRRRERPEENGTTDAIKKSYLQARLGAKALLTGKVGSGATTTVYDLASLQLKECLTDGLAWYSEMSKEGRLPEGGNFRVRKMLLEAAAEDIVESLASCVEFDGLETTQDPSPRSSLTLSMYTEEKATFVGRMLAERTVPSCDGFVNCFGPEVRAKCERYIRINYDGEAPPLQQPLVSPFSE